MNDQNITKNLIDVLWNGGLYTGKDSQFLGDISKISLAFFLWLQCLRLKKKNVSDHSTHKTRFQWLILCDNLTTPSKFQEEYCYSIDNKQRTKRKTTMRKSPSKRYLHESCLYFWFQRIELVHRQTSFTLSLPRSHQWFSLLSTIRF